MLTSRGTLVDRFHDGVTIPVHDAGGQVVRRTRAIGRLGCHSWVLGEESDAGNSADQCDVDLAEREAGVAAHLESVEKS